MNHLKQNQSFNRNASLVKDRALKTMIAYEDFDGAIHAKETLDRLAGQLNPGIEITNELWKFDVLRHSEVRREAAGGALAADMIIIAANGAAEPPPHVKSWIESWLPQKRESVFALVALLYLENQTPCEPSPLDAYLRRMAREWSVDFFSNSTDW